MENSTRKRIVIVLRPEVAAKAEELAKLADIYRGDPEVSALGEFRVEDDPDETVGILVKIRRGDRDLAWRVIQGALQERCILRAVDPGPEPRRCDAVCPPPGVSAGEQCHMTLGHTGPHEALGGTGWPDHLTRRRAGDAGHVLSDVRAEREACAQIADAVAKASGRGSPIRDTETATAMGIAETIRARGGGQAGGVVG